MTKEDELFQKIADAIWSANFHPDDVVSGEPERRKADWTSDWAHAKRQAAAVYYDVLQKEKVR